MMDAEVGLMRLLALKMEEEAMGQGVQVASEAGKGKQMDSLLEFPGRNTIQLI